MHIADVLLAEYNHEIDGTRRILALVPADKGDWAPHEKSMKLGKLAEHVARLAEFGEMVMTTEDMDVATMKFPQWNFTDAESLLSALEESSSKLKNTVTNLSDENLQQQWKLRFGDHVIAQMPKYVAFRNMFMNHLVHHRAQLGVYLRLLNIPIPGLYGPSADEQPPIPKK